MSDLEPNSIRWDIENKLEPVSGRVLISEPFLDDAYFGRSVVLLCEHSADGTFGFVLNNYIEIDVRDLVPEIPQPASRLSIGGPVKTGNLYYLHTAGDIEGSVKVIDNVHMGGDFDEIKFRLANNLLGLDQVRFFVGYSGWESGQLEEELERNSWLVAEMNADEIMKTRHKDLWSGLMKRQGNDYAPMANFPKDPALN